MLKTGFVTDSRYLDHDTGQGHPERADRLRACLTALEQVDLELIPIRPQLATIEQLRYAHTIGHIDRVRQHCQQQIPLEYDTTVVQASYEAALLATGAVIAVAEAVISSQIDNGFALVRPPGHHATPDRAMGFCLFNNVAITARHLQRVHGLERIAIIDWDVHHGNGTQDIFYADPSVLFFSIHQSPLYPGTGLAKETGTGEGAGTTLNCPMPPYSGVADYVQRFREQLQPRVVEFNPDCIFISAGFDAHQRDPLSQMNMTSEGFADLTEIVQEMADTVCQGRVVSLLEGGYDLEGLSTSVLAHLTRLSDSDDQI